MGAILKELKLHQPTLDGEMAEISMPPLEKLVDDFIAAYDVYAAEDGQMEREYEAGQDRITYDELRLAFVTKFLKDNNAQYYNPKAFFLEYETVVKKRIEQKKRQEVADILSAVNQTSLPLGPEDHGQAIREANAILNPSEIDHHAFSVASLAEELVEAHPEIIEAGVVNSQYPDREEEVYVHAERVYQFLKAQNVHEENVRQLGELLGH